MKTCVFCKIAKRELPSYIFFDDGEFIAFLDINPNVTGMSLVAPKKHYSSDVFEMPDDVLKRCMIATKKVIKILEKKLKCKRVGVIIEGMGLNHAHIKLYPMHGLKRKYKTMIHPKRTFFKKYEGYLTSLLGTEAKKEDLERVCTLLKK